MFFDQTFVNFTPVQFWFPLGGGMPHGVDFSSEGCTPFTRGCVVFGNGPGQFDGFLVYNNGADNLYQYITIICHPRPSSSAPPPPQSSEPPPYSSAPPASSDGFVPPSGLVLQLDAKSLALNDGDPVAAWNDGSGNGNNAAQSDGGLQPVYHNYGANGTGGDTHPCVGFYNGPRMAIPMAGSLLLSDITAFVVAYRAGDFTGNGWFFLNFDDAGNGIHIGAIAIDQPTGRMNQSTNSADIAFKQPQGRGIGNHQPGDIVI